MADRPDLASDGALEAALRDLGGRIAYPTARPGEPDLAARVRLAIEAGQRVERRPWWRIAAPGGRSLRLSLALGLVALAVLAAVAGAAILGVPGIRISLFGGPGPTATPPPSVRPSLDLPPGSGAGLGEIVTLDGAAAIVGFEPVVPEGHGHPDAAWVSGHRLSLVWRSGPRLPEIGLPGAGLLITEFRGDVDDGFFEKTVDAGTRVERVAVAGRPGYWLSGGPHWLFYVDEDGTFVEETRRVVGDALIWEADGLTFRIESALGRAATIALAEGLAIGG